MSFAKDLEALGVNKKPTNPKEEALKKSVQIPMTRVDSYLPKGVLAQSRGDTDISVLGVVIASGESWVRIKDPKDRKRTMKDPVTGEERELEPGVQFIAFKKNEYEFEPEETYRFYCTMTINIKKNPDTDQLYADPVFGVKNAVGIKKN